MSRKISSGPLSYLKQFLHSRTRRVRILKLLLLSLPVFIYGVGLLRSGNDIAPGDADYYMQLYEAARRSILEFHQFPWWNPWVSGGVPLFANPQFGPLSVQMVTTLLFGSIFGYKLALVIYLTIGFLGMRHLLVNAYDAHDVHATLLSYIWVFSSFFVWRSYGHFTFFIVGLFPWLLYFFLKRSDAKNWLWFSLVGVALVWSSLHYTTILSFLIIGLFGIAQFIELTLHYIRKEKEVGYGYHIFRGLSLDKVFYSLILIALLTFPRLITTLEYTNDYPRKQDQVLEETVSIDITWYALFGPDQYKNPPAYGAWGWGEIASYIGILTFFVLLITLVIFIQKSRYRTFNTWLLIIMIGFCLMMARADFAGWAPFTLSRELPVFSSMRVATRWIAWAAIFILIFIGSIRITNKRMRHIVTTLLTLTVLELFVTGFPKLNDTYKIPEPIITNSNAAFTQRSHWNNKRAGIFYDENFTEATRNNIGQIIAGDSLIDTRAAVKTVRCDEIDPQCKFVSDNAVIKFWSPNKIILRRVAPGMIALNLNVGSHWSVNGKYPYRSYKVVDPAVPFIIEDKSSEIILEYKPVLFTY